MGVYHLMGLGRSPGTVIGPLSYLARRYTRWGPDDERFFARSGEREHRAERKKVGSVQAVVLFTSPEVISGEMNTSAYNDNAYGSRTGTEVAGGSMRELLRRLLAAEWRNAASGQNRSGADLFWCEVDMRDIAAAYVRMVRVVAALEGVGGQGKEMWANLTGGSNVVNLALQLAASLSGSVGRAYYVQARDGEEKCLRCPSEEGYWVEMPVMPLTLSPVGLDVMEVVAAGAPLSAREVWGELTGTAVHWKALEELDAASFVRVHLAPLWRAGLIEEVSPRRVPDPEKEFAVGPHWPAVEPYVRELERARADGSGIERLAEEAAWLTRETIPFT